MWGRTGIFLIFFLCLYAFPSKVLSDSFTIGYGPVREADSISLSHVIAFDYQISDHIKLTAGKLFGEGTATDYSTAWSGIALVEREKYLQGSIGYVRLTNQTTHLTSQFQFITTFGIHYNHWMLSYEHMSNGGTGGSNLGEDFLVLGYRF